MKKTTMIMVLVMAAAASYAAISDNASIMFPILDMGTGARALGMGGAFTAVADDSSAIYWNAAGLGTIKNPELSLTYNKWFLDTMFSQALFVMPLSTGAIGADLVYVNLGEMPLRDIYGVTTGSVSPYMIGGSLGYGVNFGVLSAGAVLKVISQSMDNISNAAFAADAGALFRSGMFSAGLSLQNIGSGNGYSLPMNIKTGIALKPLDMPQHSLIFDIDGQYLFKDAFSLSAGAEYIYMNMLAIRAGYRADFGQTNLDGLQGISGGLGVKISSLSIDYAIVPYGDLGITQRVTLSFMFGNQPQDANAGMKTQVKPAAKPAEKELVKATVKDAAKTPVKNEKEKASRPKPKKTPVPEQTPIPVNM